VTSDKSYSTEQRLNALVTSIGAGSYENVDGNTYDLGALSQVCITNQTISTTSGTTVTALQAPVAAQWYYMRAVIDGTQGGTADNQYLYLDGPASSFMSIDWYALQNGSTTISAGNITSGGTPASGAEMPKFTASTNFWCYIEGPVLFTAAGTFGISAANATSGHTFVVATGSTLRLWPITNQAA
jgi:hypothetical protein